MALCQLELYLTSETPWNSLNHEKNGDSEDKCPDIPAFALGFQAEKRYIRNNLDICLPQVELMVISGWHLDSPETNKNSVTERTNPCSKNYTDDKIVINFKGKEWTHIWSVSLVKIVKVSKPWITKQSHCSNGWIKCGILCNNGWIKCGILKAS